MRRLLIVTASILSLLALSFAPAKPAVAQLEWDWFYSFEISENGPYCFNIIEGEWRFFTFPQGFVFTENVPGESYGQFLANFSFFRNVYLTQAIIYFSSSAPFLMSANYEIFGMEGSFLEPGVNGTSITLTPESAGLNSNTINLAMQYDAELAETVAIAEIQFFGNGASPFEDLEEYWYDNCDTASPTATPTNTPGPPTATYTPSLTRTPTETLTPSPTLTLTPTFTLTVDPCEGSLNAVSLGGGEYSLINTFDCPSGLVTTVTSGSITAGAGDAGSYGVDGGVAFPQSTAAVIIDVDPSWTIKSFGAYSKFVNVGSTNADVYIDWKTVGGTFSHFTTVDHPGNGFFKLGQYTAGGGGLTNVSQIMIIAQAYDASGSHAWLDNVFVNFVGSYSTPTGTAGAPTATPSATLTPSQTRTPHPDPSVTLPPLTFPPLGTLTTSTPVPPTPTRLPIQPTGTPLPQATYTALPTYTLYPSQTLVPTVGTPTLTATFDDLGLGPGMPLPWGQALPTDQSANEIGGAGNDVISFGTNLMRQARRYLDTLQETVGGIYDDWNDADPIEIPALPHCATDRLASELCAIYYILTWTVLAGTIGSLLLPAALFVLDLWIVFAFIKLVRAFLERLAKVQDIQ